MTSHDVRISVEHYENGGYGVIGYNFEEMGLMSMIQLKEAVDRVMSKELKRLKESKDDKEEKNE